MLNRKVHLYKSHILVVSMTFPKQFASWLEQSLSEPIPDSVKAFSLNLFELAFKEGVKYGIELIGSSKFDVDDQDWSCEEIWKPRQRRLNIPESFSGSDWEKCLDKIQFVVRDFLKTNSYGATILRSRLGVGVGFVDGDLILILP
jgi:hypothetical protein